MAFRRGRGRGDEDPLPGADAPAPPLHAPEEEGRNRAADTTSPAMPAPNAAEGALSRTAEANGLLPGTRIGEYVIERLLDSGGFSSIYRARSVGHGAAAAVKVLHADLALQPDLVLRFERELEAATRIRHPGIVQVFDQGRLESGQPYFIMELLPGISLEQHLRSSGRLTADEVLAILEPLCDALEAAHARAIVHRDIKPSNIFLSEQEGRLRVVLLDFGVAKLLDVSGPELTSSRQIVGTMMCIAPEQLLGRPVDPRTDVYGVGALTYRLLVGEPPFPDHSGSLLQQMHLYASPPRPSARAPLSPAFDEVILRALSKDREARQPTVAAFLAGFQGAVSASRGMGAPPPGGRARAALAIYTEVQADPGALDEPDDRLLADIEAILPFVSSELTEAGLSLVAETGSSRLFTADRADDPARDEQARRSAVDAALAIHRRLEGRAGRDPRVHIRLCLHAGELLSTAEGAFVGGDLLEVAGWVPDVADDGVFASPEILAGLGDAAGLAGGEPRSTSGARLSERRLLRIAGRA